MFTVGNLKNDMSRMVSPANIGDSKDLNGAIESASRKMLSFIKPKDLTRRVIIENALYYGQNSYKSPYDLDTNKIVQWYKLTSDHSDLTGLRKQVSNSDFDSFHNWSRVNSELFSIEYQSGNKIIKAPNITQVPQELTISRMDAVDENGLWNVFGNVVNIAKDDLTFDSGNGSLRFDINNSTNSGGIFNNTIEEVDIIDYLNRGKAFIWMSIPEKLGMQSITLTLGSSPTDYYEVTVNGPNDGEKFQNGVNTIGFALDRDVMNTIGTPNPRKINSVKITFLTNSSLQQTSVRIDSLVLRIGQVYGIQYISNAMFQDVTTGTNHMSIKDDSDIITVEYDTYQMLLSFASYELGMELLTERADRERLENEMNKSITLYKKRHKEEFIEQTQTLRKFGAEYGSQNYHERVNTRDLDREI